MANRSPPGPHIMGSVRLSMALVATAASTALPPALRMSMPAMLANGWLEQTMPCRQATVERFWFRLRSSSRSSGRSEADGSWAWSDSGLATAARQVPPASLRKSCRCMTIAPRRTDFSPFIGRRIEIRPTVSRRIEIRPTTLGLCPLIAEKLERLGNLHRCDRRARRIPGCKNRGSRSISGRGSRRRTTARPVRAARGSREARWTWCTYGPPEMKAPRSLVSSMFMW